MQDFHADLVGLLPRMRGWARALTRDRTAAEDLVQDTVVHALAGQDGFTPGTNMQAWLHRILYNRFISTLRKSRETEDIGNVPEQRFARAPQNDNHLILKELRHAFWRLPCGNREALVMIVVHGMTYEEAAAALGCATGTIKSRVYRARMQLQADLLGEAPAPDAARATRPAVAGPGEGLTLPAQA